MKTHHARIIPHTIVSSIRLGTIFFSLVATAMSALPPTLDDVDRTAPPPPRPGTPRVYGLPYPRINLTETTAPDIEIASKYNTVSYSGAHINRAADLKAKYPATMVIRYFVSGTYQSTNEGNGDQRSFLSTGPASVGTAVYAGHWLYLPGSRLTNPIDSKALVLSVNDPSRFTAGQYVVIYNGNPGDFRNAEHARIASIDRSRGRLILEARGFKSTPASHHAGAVVAQHQLGAGGTGGPRKPESWAYNLGSSCPRDANGKQMNAVMAEWLALHLNLDRDGNRVGNFAYDGVLFDGERSYFYPDPVDMDNDLEVDGGLNPVTGEDIRGDGLQGFYAKLRGFVGASQILVASNGTMRGYSDLNGVQCEGYPNLNTAYIFPPNHSLTDSKLASYSYHLHHHAYGPVYSEILSKVPTLLYPLPRNGGSRPTSNSPFRYSFGVALLENGSYGQRRPGVDDPWWDEYSVNVTPGSPTFGHAIPNDSTSPAQIAKVRAHTGWLGAPLGRRTRIFDPAVFDVSKTLLPNSGFESGLGQWTGNNVKLSLQSGGGVFSGNNSLHCSSMINYGIDLNSATLLSPPLFVSSPNTYTLCFAVKSSQVRQFGVQFGSGKMQTIISGPSWQSHTLTFETDAGNKPVVFFLGRESSGLWLDEIYLFKGNADVFRRDFENGAVFVNATPKARTVRTNGRFRRIQGAQDRLNDGSSIGPQLTLPAYDAAILVRMP